MGRQINGDFLSLSSGVANIGVDATGTPWQGQQIFDFNSISPFGQIHQNSGVFHDPSQINPSSGIFRFNQGAAAFQVSVDGGISFQSLSAGAGVDSVGVIGDTDLTGNIDLASAAGSGFMAIFDTGNASPVQFAVDQLALSGLWDFPAQGFNGAMVNSLSDFNGQTIDGAVTFTGVSGLQVDIVGQDVRIGPANNIDLAAVGQCYSEVFTAATSWVANHAMNKTNVLVQVWDDSTPRRQMTPDDIQITDANNVTASFNIAQAGLIVVIACP